MITLADALNDSANITKSVELGTQALNTTGIITAGGMIIPRPYGSFSHSATVTLTGGTTADAMPFDTDDITNQITHSTSTNNSRIYVDVAGIYRIIFSLIAMGGTANKLFNCWLAVNGSNVARTNTIRNLSTANVQRIITVEMMHGFTANQYFEIMLWSNATNTIIEATAAQSNPTRPACPGIILDINKLSA